MQDEVGRPRLSVRLRRALGTNVYAESDLKRRRARLDSDAGLQWKQFSQGCGDAADSSARKLFVRFIDACKGLVDDEESIVGPELQKLALNLFHGLSTGGFRKTDVERLVGTQVKKSLVISAREAAKALHEWKSENYVDYREIIDPPFELEQESKAQHVRNDLHDGAAGTTQKVEEGDYLLNNKVSQDDKSASFAQADNTDAIAWLLEQCIFHLSKLDDSQFSAAQLRDEIVSLCEKHKADEELQGHLLDLLGFSDGTFEFMMGILERKEALLTHSSKSPPLPSPSPSLSLSPVVLNLPSERGASSASSRQQLRPDTLGRPAGTTETRIFYERLTGPGSDGKDNVDHEEAKKAFYTQVFVPAPAREQSDQQGEYRVPISAFSSLAQVAFSGINSLNRLQSAVFETAYFTNNNLLVCAPTGAGKTNVAMTTVVRELDQHASDLSQVKIVYVAPMKALAQEVVEKFGAKLKPLGLVVRELTGDMQLTRAEMERTQLIVTTPEKWDVITRKSGDGALFESVGLLIIDEVHLVGEGRGPVIESLVARTLRLVEQKQKMVRIVGLSATLPNYRDVARFLRVPAAGLFFFDSRYRPVPLDQTFIGVQERNLGKKLAMYNDICFLKARESVQKGDQVMVFVHSRKDTSKTARALLEAARKTHFRFDDNAAVDHDARSRMERLVQKSKNADVREFFGIGVGIHHAGMLRADRTLTEQLFASGAVSVLCCTATLAWGVNLPAHTVIIKGTQVYVAEKGGLVELNMQDVFQCFGRAGRPQFDTRGEAVLITEKDQLTRYLSMLTAALPLESHMLKLLPDALNAEVVSGTVTNLEEAVEWLSYTFLFQRMLANPMAYGVTHAERESDPGLRRRRSQMIVNAARDLDRSRMARFAFGAGVSSRLMGYSANARLPEPSAPFGVTDLGRVASHFYIGHGTIEEFNDRLKPDMSDEQVVDLLCRASEFEQLKVRDEELSELKKLELQQPLKVLAAPESARAKAVVLLQCYISNTYVKAFTLSSDMNYIAQNMGRVARAVFEMCLKKRWSSMTEKLLMVATAIDRRCWWAPLRHPLRQFVPALLPVDTVLRLEERKLSLESIVDMDEAEVGVQIRHQKMGPKVARCARRIPYLTVQARLQPLTRSILRVSLDIWPDFEWADKVHGGALHFWIWVDDQNCEWIYHAEKYVMTKRDYSALLKAGHEVEELDAGDRGGGKAHGGSTKAHKHPAFGSSSVSSLEFTIPIFEPLPPQYHLRIFCNGWMGSEGVVTMTLDKLTLPPRVKQHTDLLELTPLPRSALQNAAFDQLYREKFSHFNPLQTQAFHVLYHTDRPVLVGAPTGSGKTVTAELALLRMFRVHPAAKAVYIAPLKALVAERAKEWSRSLQQVLGKRVVEFTGDVSPEPGVLRRADVLITTPEKWDGASRMWASREYVRDVRLIVIDEIHLLGEERGAVLEVLVTRMRYVAQQTGAPVRVVGLSTALANAHDLGNWLGVQRDNVGLYNFRPAVRPVPLEVHIHGFPGKHYCPRMATMNKPAFQAILTHSPEKPALIFVASRRQTRLTALDLISLCAASDRPRRFLHMPFEDAAYLAEHKARDDTLKHTLAFGIGIHHAGLAPSDRDLVEELFLSGKVQVLVCTATLAWGVNLPAHLVVIKGTEFFDAKTRRYQPFPITDVLQMMGRAGRPQFDDSGVAMIFVQEALKDFYKKFLYEPFPVESHLPEFLHNHLNAEIACGSINSEADAMDYLTWTYFFRRLPQNPSYYGLDSNQPEDIARFLLDLVRQVTQDLAEAGCCQLHSSRPLDHQSSSGSGGGGGGRQGLGDSNKGGWARSGTTSVATGETVAKSRRVQTTPLGKIASFYYLDYRTAAHFRQFFLSEGRDEQTSQSSSASWKKDTELRMRTVFELIAGAHEFSQVPVRHNEDLVNADLAQLVPWDPFEELTWEVDSPHAKTFLLLQAHIKRLPMPVKDYIGDTKSVLDQFHRVANALVDFATHFQRLDAALATMQSVQCIAEARPWDQAVARKNGGENPLPLVRERSQLVRKDFPFISLRLEQGASREFICTGVVENYDACQKFAREGSTKKKYAWWFVLADGDTLLATQSVLGIQPKLTMRYEAMNAQQTPNRVWLVSGSLLRTNFYAELK